jgi:hypothetical protein
VIHYHGTPITPASVLGQLAGRSFCVSFAHPDQVETVHTIGQSVMLDNGAFSSWRQHTPTDWPGYYSWCERWLEYQSTWAVIPDVIDGTAEDNDALIRQWPHGDRGAPVWHMHEPIERLLRLADSWPRVCLGSSGRYATVGNDRWRYRMDATMNALCGSGPAPVWLHMLRGMSLSSSEYPFASVDSTDIARNHARPRNDALEMALRWDARQCPSRWSHREQLCLTTAA